MGMREQVLELKQRIDGYVSEFEDAYAKIAKEKEPGALEILLPIAYRHLIDHAERTKADQRMLSFIGQYLASRHPGMGSYFIGSRQRQTLEELRDLLTKEMEDPHGKDS
jgi:hypothetical protein